MAAQGVRVVTDVSCELDRDTLERLQVTLVPGYINEGEQSTLFDGFNLDRVKYYDDLKDKDPLPTTAAPAPGVVQEILEKAFAEAGHLLMITLPRSLSAYYESFRLGSEHFPQGSVTLLESGTISTAQDMQILVAAEVAAGGGTLEQALDAVQRARANTVSATALATMENLRRSGRVNMATAGLATLLQIKPILSVSDSEVITHARVRTFRKARLELVRMMQQQAPFERLVISHTNNLDDAHWLAEQGADLVPEPATLVNSSPIMGTHLGAGTLGYTALRAGWSD